MATKKIPFQFYLVQDKSSNPRKSGKWYGRRFMPTTLGTRGLAQHMMNHGVIAERSEIEDVLNGLVTCIPELLSQGVGVKLDGLGTFYPSMTSKGVSDPTKYVAGKHITGIHIRIRPWSEKVGNLTSKALLSQCELEYVGEVETITVNNKKKIVLHRPQPEEGGEG